MSLVVEAKIDKKLHLLFYHSTIIFVRISIAFNEPFQGAPHASYSLRKPRIIAILVKNN